MEVALVSGMVGAAGGLIDEEVGSGGTGTGGYLDVLVGCAMGWWVASGMEIGAAALGVGSGVGVIPEQVGAVCIGGEAFSGGLVIGAAVAGGLT